MSLTDSPSPPSPSDLYFLTDYPAPYWSGYSLPASELVMYLGPDTCCLLKSLPLLSSPQPQAILDLCSGSGVQGLTLAKIAGSPSITLVDVNPRASKFASFNCALNQVKADLHLVNANLLDPAQVSSLIPPSTPECSVTVTANPPFVPDAAPSSQPLYTTAGRRGDEVRTAEERGILLSLPSSLLTFHLSLRSSPFLLLLSPRFST